MESNDVVFGSLLIATWLNTLLYTLEINQACSYYRMYSTNDRLCVRLIVVLCLLVDTVNIIGQYATVYLYTVTYWGDPMFALHQQWSIALSGVSTTITAVLVQFFLIHRYNSLAKQPIIACFLVLLSLVALAGALSAAINFASHDPYLHHDKINSSISVWLSFGTATDCLIAAALVVQLRRMRSGFKFSDGLVRRISVMTIQTGGATSVLAVAALVTYLRNNNNNVSNIFIFCLGCTYTLTMLYNLNKRQSLCRIPGIGNSVSFSGELGSLGLNLTALKGNRQSADLPVRQNSLLPQELHGPELTASKSNMTMTTTTQQTTELPGTMDAGFSEASESQTL
jgi:hypothetical protein